MEFKGTKDKWILAKFKTKVLSKPKQNWMPVQPICFVAEVPMNREARTANALLISKAPEMLQMLEKLSDMDGEDFTQDIQDEILKLIKEATII